MESSREPSNLSQWAAEYLIWGGLWQLALTRTRSRLGIRRDIRQVGHGILGTKVVSQSMHQLLKPLIQIALQLHFGKPHDLFQPSV